MGRIPVLGPLTANNGHRERIHVAAPHLRVHATRVLLDAADLLAWEHAENEAEHQALALALDERGGRRLVGCPR